LDLGNALLCGLALPANMIRLLLQAATIDNLTLQGSFDSSSLAFRLRGLGLGSSEPIAQRFVGVANRPQLR